MPNPAITVENLSKRYRLGEVGTGTISHDLNRVWARLRGKPDPYAKIGATNDRASKDGDSTSDYVWALKDINFEVQPGEVLGIIGKNGAGKSTLLKLLSRVTAPTTGKIQLDGRVASLLEVGTGFHPELTGRENIYLNGAIMGMTRAEIRSRFDDIVDFAGCAKYIDTPVKRYSSGMYVRLAFAVAAHLEPEILIVDEVLAVGDAEFQDRCIGKMKEVSGKGGRTVIFVSHNMESVRNLCPNSILLENGTIKYSGLSDEVIGSYLRNSSANAVRMLTGKIEHECAELKLASIAISDERGMVDSIITTATALTVSIAYTMLSETKNLRIVTTLISRSGAEIFATSDFLAQHDSRVRSSGCYISKFTIPPNFLVATRYTVQIDFEIPGERALLSSVYLPLEIAEQSINQLGTTRSGRPPGQVHPILEWAVERSS